VAANQTRILNRRQAFLLQRKETIMKFNRNIGFLLLAIWLILYGLIALLGLSFSGLSLIMALLALAAGIFILLNRWVIVAVQRSAGRLQKISR
jgi:hypothetical protein